MNKKVIFITAAAGAMGSSQAQIFSKHGYKIFLTDIDKKKLISLEKKLKIQNSEVSFSLLDVRSESSWKNMSADFCPAFRTGAASNRCSTCCRTSISM